MRCRAHPLRARLLRAVHERAHRERAVGCAAGLRALPDAIAADLPARVAGLVPDASDDPAGFDPTVAIAPKDLKKMDRFIQFAMVAAKEAI